MIPGLCIQHDAYSKGKITLTEECVNLGTAGFGTGKKTIGLLGLNDLHVIEKDFFFHFWALGITTRCIIPLEHEHQLVSMSKFLCYQYQSF